MSDEATERRRSEDRLIKWMEGREARSNANHEDAMSEIASVAAEFRAFANGNGQPGVKVRLALVEAFVSRGKRWRAVFTGCLIGLPFYLARAPLSEWVAALL